VQSLDLRAPADNSRPPAVGELQVLPGDKVRYRFQFANFDYDTGELLQWRDYDLRREVVTDKTVSATWLVATFNT